jgi:uncharacterized protein YqeY
VRGARDARAWSGAGASRGRAPSAIVADPARNAARTDAPELTKEHSMSDPTILERIQSDMAVAMKAREADKLSTLRMLKTALMEAKTKKPRDAVLSSDEEIEVLQRYVKKRREVIEEMRKAGRADVIASEEREIAVTQVYLPQGMAEDELRKLVLEAIARTGAAGPKDMGKVIGAVMAQVKGRAEGSMVSRLVKEALPQG